MSSNHRTKVLAGAIALAVAGTALTGTALADTLESTTTGDIFLNIVDTTNNTSYLYNTGISQAAFNPNAPLTFTLSSDPLLTAFINSTDSYNFSVIDSTKTAGASTIDFTGASLPAVSAFHLNQAQGAVNSFTLAANLTTSSEVLPTATYWGAPLTEGIFSKQLFNNPNQPYSDNGALNTALAFYQGVGSTLTTFAGTWTFSTNFGAGANQVDVLKYSGSQSPVPLPTPLLLLVSGLGLMGVVSRRTKTAV